MARQSRGRAPREIEQTQIIVEGNDVKGESFQEETQTIDISESGISFYLKTPIWMDSHLTLKIMSSSLFEADYSLKAKVVRMQNESSGKKLIGARFD
jgi:hypothetical protein